MPFSAFPLLHWSPLSLKEAEEFSTWEKIFLAKFKYISIALVKLSLPFQCGIAATFPSLVFPAKGTATGCSESLAQCLSSSPLVRPFYFFQENMDPFRQAAWQSEYLFVVEQSTISSMICAV
jgi:hypothetical protein